MANVLIIDDDQTICGLLREMVANLGHAATQANTLKEGMARASSGQVDLVFLDVGMPDGNGLKILGRIRALANPPEVIIITGQGDADGAEIAIRNGAWAYVEKGSSLRQILLPLTRALQYREERTASKPVALKHEDIVGNGQAMRHCYNLLAQAAGSQANVLISGETGTGKELFARAVHENSTRFKRDLVVVDCAAIPETLVESLLFGHEKGSFTGADSAREGLVAQANGGTLFLDEVGELPLAMQRTFLRTLQERRYRPLGGKTEIQSDFRLVAATNRDLDDMVRKGQFRNDLLYRLRTLTINLPTLTQRKEDLGALVLHHVAKLCGRYRLPQKGFSPDFLDTLAQHDWPGNVRELLATLEQAVAAALDSATLFPHHLPEFLRIKSAKRALANPGNTQAQRTPQAELPEDLPEIKTFLRRETAKLEKAYLAQLLEVSGGDIAKACQVAGLGRSSLYERLKRHGLSRRN